MVYDVYLKQALKKAFFHSKEGIVEEGVGIIIVNRDALAAYRRGEDEAAQSMSLGNFLYFWKTEGQAVADTNVRHGKLIRDLDLGNGIEMAKQLLNSSKRVSEVAKLIFSD